MELVKITKIIIIIIAIMAGIVFIKTVVINVRARVRKLETLAISLNILSQQINKFNIRINPQTIKQLKLLLLVVVPFSKYLLHFFLPFRQYQED